MTVEEVDEQTPGDRLQFGVVEEPPEDATGAAGLLGVAAARLAVSRGVSIVSVHSDDDGGRSARASVSPGPDDDGGAADAPWCDAGNVREGLAGRRLQRLDTVEASSVEASAPTTPTVSDPPPAKRAASAAEDDEDPALEALLRRVQKQRSVLEEILDKEGEKAQSALGEGTSPARGPASARPRPLAF